MPGRVVVCGNVVFDILVRKVEDPIRWAATTLIEEVSQQLGGNGSTTSYTIGKLGVPVTIVTLLGRDPAADAVLARLRSAEVDLSLVQYVNAATSTAICLIRGNGERALLYQLGAASEEFSPFELPEGATHFHLAAVYRMRHLRQTGPALIERAKRAGLRTSLDTQWDTEGEWMKVLAPSLPWTDYTLVNEDEARMLTGHSKPAAAARTLREAGATNVVIKLGARGSWVNGVEIPGFCVQAVDSTGAGDCFAGAFIAALERGFSPEAAARFGNAVGALSVQRIGATAGVLDWRATEQWISAHS